MAGFIPDEFIQRILDETDVVSLIDSFVPLKKKGKDHWAQCPFCDDGSNPSFSVSQQKQFYYCFRCRASGNVIGFLMNFQSRDFQGAIEILASNAGLEIPTQGQDKSYEKNKKLYEINLHAAEFYVNNLKNHPEADSIRTYLSERGISEDICETFQIGFAPKGWDNLLNHFNKILPEELKEEDAGLFKISEKNNKRYDTYRNRIMFPIKSKRNQIIGFGARIIDPEDNPKYLNSAESDIFKKGRELYGLNEILNSKHKPNKIIAVEGYTDVLSLFSNNINYAVATLGIATSKYHLEKIFNHVDEVIFCFDGDEAGVKAAESALGICLPILRDGKKMKFLFLPEDEDPSSLLEKEGKDDFEKRIDTATILSEYLFDMVLKKYDDSLESKAAASQEFMNTVRVMPPSNFKNILIQEFSNKIGINLTDNSKPKPKVRANNQNFLISEEVRLEMNKVTKSIVKTLLDNPDLAKMSELDFFADENSFMKEFLVFLRGKENLTFPMILQAFEGKKQFLIDLAEDRNLIATEEAKDYILQAVAYLKKSNKVDLLSELKKQLSDNTISTTDKIELKKLLMNNFDNLDESEIMILKEI
jgi:DNA primase|tara:strand:- start:1813 stop:3579 length:1767 start_codon:yes stop_codon:yes gene_type:complete